MFGLQVGISCLRLAYIIQIGKSWNPVDFSDVSVDFMVFCNIKSYIQTWIEKVSFFCIIGPRYSGRNVQFILNERKVMLQEKLSNKPLAMSKIIACQKFFAQFHSQTSISQAGIIGSVGFKTNIVPNVHVSVDFGFVADIFVHILPSSPVDI